MTFSTFLLIRHSFDFVTEDSKSSGENLQNDNSTLRGDSAAPDDEDDSDSEDGEPPEPLYLKFIGKLSAENFRFSPLGGWTPGFSNPLSTVCAVAVVSKPDSGGTDFNREYAQIFRNIDAIQRSAPGKSTVFEHFLKGENEKMGIRVTHKIFRVSLFRYFYSPALHSHFTFLRTTQAMEKLPVSRLSIMRASCSD